MCLSFLMQLTAGTRGVPSRFSTVNYAGLLPTTMSSLPVWHFPPPAYSVSLVSSLALLIFSEFSSLYTGSALFKIAASLSFFTAGLSAASRKIDLLSLKLDDLSLPEIGVLAVVAGLGLSVLGDIFLIPTKEAYYNSEKKEDEGQSLWFRVGTGFFALAHVAYIIGFSTSTPLLEVTWEFFTPSMIVGFIICYALGPLQAEVSPDALIPVPRAMRGLVMSYCSVIIIMVASATATDLDPWRQRTAGAWLFMASDLFVAMDVYGKKKPVDIKKKGKAQEKSAGRDGWQPRALGWVLYFGAQLIIVGTLWA